MVGRGRMEGGGKKMRALLLRKGQKEVDRREGREEEGICRTNVKVLPTPLPFACRPRNTRHQQLFRDLRLLCHRRSQKLELGGVD